MISRLLALLFIILAVNAHPLPSSSSEVRGRVSHFLAKKGEFFPEAVPHFAANGHIMLGDSFLNISLNDIFNYTLGDVLDGVFNNILNISSEQLLDSFTRNYLNLSLRSLLNRTAKNLLESTTVHGLLNNLTDGLLDKFLAYNLYDLSDDIVSFQFGANVSTKSLINEPLIDFVSANLLNIKDVFGDEIYNLTASLLDVTLESLVKEWTNISLDSFFNQNVHDLLNSELARINPEFDIDAILASSVYDFISVTLELPLNEWEGLTLSLREVVTEMFFTYDDEVEERGPTLNEFLEGTIYTYLNTIFFSKDGSLDDFLSQSLYNVFGIETLLSETDIFKETLLTMLDNVVPATEIAETSLYTLFGIREGDEYCEQLKVLSTNNNLHEKLTGIVKQRRLRLVKNQYEDGNEEEEEKEEEEEQKEEQEEEKEQEEEESYNQGESCRRDRSGFLPDSFKESLNQSVDQYLYEVMSERNLSSFLDSKSVEDFVAEYLSSISVGEDEEGAPITLDLRADILDVTLGDVLVKYVGEMFGWESSDDVKGFLAQSVREFLSEMFGIDVDEYKEWLESMSLEELLGGYVEGLKEVLSEFGLLDALAGITDSLDNALGTSVWELISSNWPAGVTLGQTPEEIFEKSLNEIAEIFLGISIADELNHTVFDVLDSSILFNGTLGSVLSQTPLSFLQHLVTVLEVNNLLEVLTTNLNTVINKYLNQFTVFKWLLDPDLDAFTHRTLFGWSDKITDGWFSKFFNRTVYDVANEIWDDVFGKYIANISYVQNMHALLFVHNGGSGIIGTKSKPLASINAAYTKDADAKIYLLTADNYTLPWAESGEGQGHQITGVSKILTSTSTLGFDVASSVNTVTKVSQALTGNAYFVLKNLKVEFGTESAGSTLVSHHSSNDVGFVNVQFVGTFPTYLVEHGGSGVVQFTDVSITQTKTEIPVGGGLIYSTGLLGRGQWRVTNVVVTNVDVIGPFALFEEAQQKNVGLDVVITNSSFTNITVVDGAAQIQQGDAATSSGVVFSARNYNIDRFVRITNTTFEKIQDTKQAFTAPVHICIPESGVDINFNLVSFKENSGYFTGGFYINAGSFIKIEGVHFEKNKFALSNGASDICVASTASVADIKELVLDTCSDSCKPWANQFQLITTYLKSCTNTPPQGCNSSYVPPPDITISEPTSSAKLKDELEKGDVAQFVHLTNPSPGNTYGLPPVVTGVGSEGAEAKEVVVIVGLGADVTNVAVDVASSYRAPAISVEAAPNDDTVALPTLVCIMVAQNSTFSLSKITISFEAAVAQSRSHTNADTSDAHAFAVVDSQGDFSIHDASVKATGTSFPTYFLRFVSGKVSLTKVTFKNITLNHYFITLPTGSDSQSYFSIQNSHISEITLPSANAVPLFYELAATSGSNTVTFNGVTIDNITVAGETGTAGGEPPTQSAAVFHSRNDNAKRKITITDSTFSHIETNNFYAPVVISGTVQAGFEASFNKVVFFTDNAYYAGAIYSNIDYNISITSSIFFDNVYACPYTGYGNDISLIGSADVELVSTCSSSNLPQINKADRAEDLTVCENLGEDVVIRPPGEEKKPQTPPPGKKKKIEMWLIVVIAVAGAVVVLAVVVVVVVIVVVLSKKKKGEGKGEKIITRQGSNTTSETVSYHAEEQ